MKTVFLLCAVFALRVATGPIEENVALQPNRTREDGPSGLWAQLAGRMTKDKPLPAMETRSMTSGDIKQDWVSCRSVGYSYGYRCFMFFTTPMTWIDAENYCLYLGVNLASIHNLEEHDFIKELASLNSSPSYWIGGSDAVKSLKWLWSDGSIFNYNNWGRGEPNDVDGKEKCIEMISRDGWNDRSCEVSLPFVCGTRAYRSI